MTKVSLIPGWHDVPAAMGIMADHMPEAQRWNSVPPTQFHSPSGVHAVPTAIAPEDPELEPGPEPVLPVPLGTAAEAVLPDP